MKNIVLFICILISSSLKCQEFGLEDFVEMLNSQNIDLKKPESKEQIMLYHYFRKNESDSLKIYKIYKVRYLANNVIQLKSKKRSAIFCKTEYFKFDAHNFVFDCKRNGEITYDTNFRNHRYEYFRIGADSIIIDKTIDDNSPDSLCIWLDKLVYRNGRLEEKWHKYGPFDGCDWRTGSYMIEKYSFPDSLTKRIDISDIKLENIKVDLSYFKLIKYNQSGDKIAFEIFDIDNPYIPSNGYYWTYTEGRLLKIVSVYKSKILEEIRFQ